MGRDSDRDRDLVYGRNAAREALRAGRRRFFKLLVAEATDDTERIEELLALAQQRLVPVERVPRDLIERRVNANHQGVALETSGYPYVTDDGLREIAQRKGVVLALDGMTDPQNVGSLLRTAEATGVELVVIPQDRAAHVTPSVVNASAGAVEHLRVTREVNLARWLERAKASGFWVIGMAGDDQTAPLFETAVEGPLVLVVGSEGDGLRRLVRDACDVIVSLPMAGQIESLNAAVAGSIALYEILRDSESIAADPG